MRCLGPCLGLFLIAVCSCSGAASTPSDIRAGSYNQRCTQAADCILIDEGSSCCTACGNAAINKADISKYEADAQSRAATCIQTPCPASACAVTSAICVADKCDVCRDLQGSGQTQ